MKSRIAGAWLAAAMLASPGFPAFANTAAATGNVPAPTAPGPTLVPGDFHVPVLAEGPGFKLVPLGPAVVKLDYDAYMSSIEHLQKTFSRSTRWPRAGITAADAMQDMTDEQGRFASRKSFAYAVLTPDGTRERGSVYVQPSPVAGYDAVVRLWVTKADYDAGFDPELYRWVAGWMRREWPFAKIAYPGRAIDWATWDALVAASKPGATPPKI